jgi:ubiquinol-cytochrome c reductase cytochrome b subunit
VEVHEPISPEKAWLLTQHEQNAPLELADLDQRGVRRPGLIKSKLRKRFAVAHAEQVAKPTLNEVRELEGH